MCKVWLKTLYQMPAENSHIYFNGTNEEDSLLTLIHVFVVCNFSYFIFAYENNYYL